MQKKKLRPKEWPKFTLKFKDYKLKGHKDPELRPYLILIHSPFYHLTLTLFPPYFPSSLVCIPFLLSPLFLLCFLLSITSFSSSFSYFFSSPSLSFPSASGFSSSSFSLSHCSCVFSFFVFYIFFIVGKVETIS